MSPQWRQQSLKLQIQLYGLNREPAGHDCHYIDSAPAATVHLKQKEITVHCERGAVLSALLVCLTHVHALSHLRARAARVDLQKLLKPAVAGVRASLSNDAKWRTAQL